MGGLALMDMLTGNPAEIPQWLQLFGRGSPAPEFSSPVLPTLSPMAQDQQAAPVAQQAMPAAPPGAAPQVDPFMESIKRLIDLNTQAYQRVSSGQKPDRVTAILRERAAEKPSWDEIGQAISQSFGSIAASHPLQPKIVTVGEALNNIRANKILEAEKLAKTQIDDERLEVERQKSLTAEIVNLVGLGLKKKEFELKEAELASKHGDLAADAVLETVKIMGKDVAPGQLADLIKRTSTRMTAEGARTKLEALRIAGEEAGSMNFDDTARLFKGNDKELQAIDTVRRLADKIRSGTATPREQIDYETAYNIATAPEVLKDLAAGKIYEIAKPPLSSYFPAPKTSAGASATSSGAAGGGTGRVSQIGTVETKPPDTAEQAKRNALDEARYNVNDILKPTLFDKNGAIRSGVIDGMYAAETGIGVLVPEGQKAYKALVRALTLRNFLISGQTVTESEVIRSFRSYIPRPWDDDQVVRDKIKSLDILLGSPSGSSKEQDELVGHRSDGKAVYQRKDGTYYSK